jgi:very-short-patch-repair endonuclease
MRERRRTRRDLGGPYRRFRLIARLAQGQFGVVTREQLLAIGLSNAAIGRMVAGGLLCPVFAGVYAVGGAHPSREGRWLAGVLAAGEGAALSHRSAGVVWDLVRWTGRVEVSAPRTLRPRPGLVVHHTAIPDDELTERDGIPLVTVPRTLLDLAAVLTLGRLEDAVNRAEMLRLGGSPGARELIARHRGRRGVARLRVALDGLDPGMSATRHEFEARFRRFIGRSALPNPEFNAPLVLAGRTYLIDCLWREQGLALELDGFESHGTRRAFRRDRARDRTLLASGLRTARVTWSDLGRPAQLESELAGMLRPPAEAPISPATRER